MAPALAFVLVVDAPDAWRATHEQAVARRDAISALLAETLAPLQDRCARERPDLLAKLSPVPPAPRPTGWGILPEITKDEPESETAAAETRFAYGELAAWQGRVLARLEALAPCVDDPGARLDELVDGWALDQENFHRIDSHVGYHAFWQASARTDVAYFRERNELLRQHRIAQAADTSPAAREKAQRQLDEAFARCRPPEFVTLETAGRELRIRLPLATDVQDPAFLAAFLSAVDRTWNESAAFREAHLRLELDLHLVALSTLFPEGKPERGAPVDLRAHRLRFSAREAVLTTGASTTHVERNALYLGPEPIAPRTLAHEVGHLLGFEDSYLRAFDGDPLGAGGVDFVEVVPGGDSLMAHPSTGRVTKSMTSALLAALRAR